MNLTVVIYQTKLHWVLKTLFGRLANHPTEGQGEDRLAGVRTSQNKLVNAENRRNRINFFFLR